MIFLQKFFFLITLILYSKDNWIRFETKHFTIFYEGNWQIPYLSMEIERIYSLMDLNLSYFAPWMHHEKTNIYIYSSRESYIKGEFKPPKWSKGLAFWDKRIIVVYNDKEKKNLIPTITHELTHLYFESFFAQKLTHPPLWLNEGLAVYMEDKSYDSEGLWERALKYSEQTTYMKFNDFLKTDVRSLKTDNEIANWYLEAYGVIRYLKEIYSQNSFYRFCDDLARGSTIEKTLWKSFGIFDLDDFEKKWFRWLGEFKIRKENKLEFRPFKKIE
jgi:hypothetical protein